MRRGNKSNKVPNVKLRPAQPSSSKYRPLAPENSFWAQDSQASTTGDSSVFDSCPRPFRGIVLCATGITDKPTLFKQAVELGASSMLAFTDRVTHLVAADHGGAKYMCALERKIPILQPAWVTECYQIWLRGDDVDLEESIEKYRLPVFSGIVLCLSGIDDIKQRTLINRLLTHQGGVYIKVLERPVKVTHLLCSGDTQTDKMRYAEKFNKSGEAKIHLVWEEWFWDSLEFGGRFDESKYQVRHPRPERKLLPEAPSSSPPHRSSSALPDALPPPSSSPPSHDPPPDRDDNGDEEELISVPRIPTVTLQLWEGLLKPRGFAIDGGKLVRSPSKSQSGTQPAIKLPVREEETGGGSLLSAFRRANSFALPLQESSVASRQPFRRTATVPTTSLALRGDSSIGKAIAGPSSPSLPPPQSAARPSSQKLFNGLRFRALGEARGASVRQAIEGCGGEIVTDEEADEVVDYVIVRLVSGSKFYRDEGDAQERVKYRTECWLEQCIFAERICAADEHVSFVPLNIKIPIAGAEKINLSFSGLDQSEACWIRRLVRALGANFAPNFSRRSSYLLCPSATGAKFEKAAEWGVPVIDMRWLEEMATTGIIPGRNSGAEVLVVHDGTTNIDRLYDGKAAPLPDTVLQRDNGKGKGKAVELMIIDTTNSQSGQSKPATQVINREVINPPQTQRVDRITIDPPDNSRSLFGIPDGSLGPAVKRRRLSSSTPPSSNRSTTIERVSDSKAKSFSADPGRIPTIGEIKRDMQATRVPSSKSPSPLKAPNGSAGPVPSPAKAKALQDGLTSLLGKRQASTEDVMMQHNKSGKRVRPHRSKPTSRQGSGDGAIAPPIPIYERPLSPFGADELNLLDGEGHSAEESMRVKYEDPGQRDEKRRLMSIFSSQSPGDDVSKRGPEKNTKKSGGPLVRRSTRIAGF